MAKIGENHNYQMPFEVKVRICFKDGIKCLKYIIRFSSMKTSENIISFEGSITYPFCNKFVVNDIVVFKI